jgi:uncharacterized protein YbaR (Trm112 family)
VYFELTDLLTCPRCGPAHGLVLLVQEVEGRRVHSGWLGCPHCRHDFPVNGGVADLRLNFEATPHSRAPLRDDELALKIVALSDLAGERGYLLIDERLAHAASAVAELADDLEVIAVRSQPDESSERHGVSRILADVRYPLAEYRLRCVAIAPRGDQELVVAAARRVAAGGRLLLFDATDEDLEEAQRSGLAVIASDGGTAVAERKVDRVLGSS